MQACVKVSGADYGGQCEMIKRMSVFLILFFTSGCGELDYDTMVCQIEDNRYSYEVSYRYDEVRFVSVEQVFDISTKEGNANEIVEEYKKISEEKSKTEGIDESVHLDATILTIVTKVDVNVYDFVQDEADVFSMPLQEDTFESIQLAKQFFEQQNFTCDDIVK